MAYDVVIVGAGAAGAILAARLSEDPNRSVLLLEAGPDYPDLESLPDDLKYGYGSPSGISTRSHDWNFVARATATAPPMAVPRGKVVGGSTAVNAQIFLRGLPEDYDAWAARGNNRWEFEEVLPYFRKLETDADFANEFHGANGPIAVCRFPREAWLPAQAAFYTACRAAGFPDCPDHNHPASTGVGPFPINNRDRIRYSTAVGHLSQARGRKNLTILADALAVRIVFDGRRATGIEVEREGKRVQVEGREIILSAGAVGSPHLLMLSGVGSAGVLGHLGILPVVDLPGVGKNLRDHPTVPMLWNLREQVRVDEQAHWHQVGLRYTAGNSDLRNDMIVYFAPLSHMHAILIRPMLNLARGSGELTLVSTNPRVQPDLDYRYFEDGFDRERLREGIRLCARLMAHEAFQEMVERRIQPTDAVLEENHALDAWMKREAATGHHICGTCKMGPASDALAVVDPFGKVHGLDGLRVVDASIMPDCVRANINATVMMIGERMADLIRQGH